MKTSLVILLSSLALLAPVHAGQPAMLAAKKEAESAIESLKNATIDKGGHRVAAIKHLEAAIAEIEAGIAFDNENVSKNEGKKGKN